MSEITWLRPQSARGTAEQSGTGPRPQVPAPELFDACFEASFDPQIIITSEGAVLRANRAACRVFGYAVAEFQGLGRADLLDLEDGRLQQALARCRAKGFLSGEFTGKRKDGSRFDMMLSPTPFTGPGGEPLAVVTLRDVTRERLTESLLGEGDARLRAVVDGLIEGVVMQDAGGRVYACNPRAEALLGLTADQMMGRTSMDPNWRAVRGDGSPFPGAEHPAVLALRSGTPVLNTLMGVHTPDGTLRWIEINANPLFRPGEAAPHAVVSSFRDVTARRQAEAALAQSEARLHRVLDQLPVEVSQWDLDLRCLYANAAYLRAYGRNAPSAVGRHMREITGIDRLSERAAYEEALRRGEARTFEMLSADVHGHDRRMSVTFVPELLNGEAVGGFAAAMDVTVLSRLVEERTSELRVAKEAAESSNQLKDQFLANVSHEMRTPLHGILAFSSLGAASLGSDSVVKGREYFARIEASGTRLTRFVDDLLHLARLQARRVVSKPQRLDFAGLLENVREDCAALLAERSQTLAITVEAADVWVEADAAMLRQVLLNLLGNACRFAPSGSTIRVVVADGEIAVPGAGAAPALMLHMLDQGPGIPELEFEAVFERFVQSSRTETRAGGTGLGLPICREIMQLHGGSIRAQNQAEGGADLELLLPRKFAGIPAPAQPTSRPRLPQ